MFLAEFLKINAEHDVLLKYVDKTARGLRHGYSYAIFKKSQG